jgi:hypothetical protein
MFRHSRSGSHKRRLPVVVLVCVAAEEAAELAYLAPRSRPVSHTLKLPVVMLLCVAAEEAGDV